IKLTKAFTGIAVAEVTAPAFRPAVEIVDHLADGDETPLGPGQFSEPVAGAGHRLCRGKHVEIALGSSEEIAVVSQRKSQKVQALTRFVQLDDSRLLAVDGALESPLQHSLDPRDQLPGLIARQYHKVVRVPHQLGVGPATGTIRAVEQFLEPMQIQVRQQRGYDPALRRALLGSSD